MSTTSATFIKGVTVVDGTLEADLPHIAFIGRSNVGKSSTINALTGVKKLAKTSAFPGRTQQLNLFRIGNAGAQGAYYLVDLPGYGFAKLSKQGRAVLQELINAYLFNAPVEQSIVFLIIDAYVGATASDLELLEALDKHHKHTVILANKVDKIKKNDVKKQLLALQHSVGNHTLIPYSADEKIGLADIHNVIGETLKNII